MGLSIQEQLMFITTRIVATQGSTVSCGTGFLFAYSLNNGDVLPVLFTNKHVLRGFERAEFICSVPSEGQLTRRRSFTITIDDPWKSSISHPNPAVDLCGVVVGQAFNSVEIDGHSARPIYIGEDLIPSDAVLSALNPIEDVTMIGYPVGLYDQANESPLIRRGITSTPVYYDFNGNPEFVVDMACVPGSSGSPVFLLNQGSYATKDGGVIVGSRIMFLGVQHAGPIYENRGRIEVTQTRDMNVSAVTPSFVNLGYVIKSKTILEMKSMFLSRLSR